MSPYAALCWAHQSGSTHWALSSSIQWALLTASNAGSDGRIQVYIGCSHPIQTRAPGHRVKQEPIQTRWPNARATEFESVNDSLGGPAPEFESDGCIRYKLGCDHPSQLFWQCLSGSNCWTLPNSIQWAPVGRTGSFWFSLSNGRFEASRLRQGGALEASAGHFYQKASSGLAGAHLYDLHYGTPFKSENVQGTLSPDANKIKLRDINFQTLFSVDMVIGQVFNFAIEIDWDKKQLRAFHSVGDEKLVEVVKTTPITPKNAKVVNFAGTGEWHLQMIKEPLPNPKDPEKERSDVPHKGIQEKGIKEEIIQLRNFIEDTSTAPGSTDPDGPGGSTSAGSSAPAVAGSTAGATSTTTAIKNNGKNKRR
ncbi:hypothetical protein PCASD_01097 [Puccinia coronata f. sp. avenae]|uniref:Glycoside hydrolase 131 catalytic N-terminal domain-containing protein n=1 Tax=Puccinia coronata f. sp. avenae TaxID=200324 RepID=A0A2N5VLL5_9BASI|nr:hypothetical protein PCASD_01097 [Puccinia coronata f. sp. avenae]